MPYCTQCGAQVTEVASFCGHCGAAQQKSTGSQPGATASPLQTGSDFLNGISPQMASTLCYIPVMGWIPCVVVLASQRFRNDNDVRFHAFQGIYLFVAWLLTGGDWGLGFLFDRSWGRIGLNLGKMIHLALIGTWIFMLVKTSQGIRFRLPLIGEWAERSLTRNA